MSSPAVDLIAEQVRAAAKDKRRLRIRGGGSKDFYGEPFAAADEVVEASALGGEPAHEPTELVVTAPAGLRIADLEATLAAANQCLPFEPPRFSAQSTVGGMVAAGLAGPARPAAGSVRDHVLGVSIVDGKGDLLHFGGRVIKNVAGYDVSRVVAGSLGILGVIVEVSLKVLPTAPRTATRRFDLAPRAALAQLDEWAGRPLPIDASAWWNGNLVVRLRGSAAAVDEGVAQIGGDPIEDDAAAPFWDALRDQKDPFFAAADEAIAAQDATLWRLSLPPAAPFLGLAGDELIEWHGAQRWLATALPAAQVREAAARAGGHATIHRGRDKSAGVFTPLAPPLARIHERLKASFDPAGILNPGRLYPGL